VPPQHLVDGGVAGRISRRGEIRSYLRDPSMRLPRVRLTVRWMLALVAVIAVAIYVTIEVWDGLPPRFVVDGIPARIERLRKGMTRQDTEDILGIGKPWYRGGTDARLASGFVSGHIIYESYNVRPLRFPPGSTRPGPGGRPKPAWQTSALIEVRFDVGGSLPHTPPKLVYASFSNNARMIAEMPRSR
jgi:hypothetical protein